MLRELVKIFGSGQPLSGMGDNFTQMLELSLELTKRGGEIYFGKAVTPEERTRLHKQDVKVNKLERKIRKQVILHLSVQSNSQDLPYCLLLMSLVKDVERIGDYAEDLADLAHLCDDPLPEDDTVAELREVRSQVETDFEEACDVFASSDRERALDLIRGGRDLVERCDDLIETIAYSDHKAGAATVLSLGARFYQRITGHVLNVLSSVVMPLHKLDYYDEKDIAKMEKA